VYTILKKDYASAPSHLPEITIWAQNDWIFVKLDPGDYLGPLKKYRYDADLVKRIYKNVVTIRILSA